MSDATPPPPVTTPSHAAGPPPATATAAATVFPPASAPPPAPEPAVPAADAHGADAGAPDFDDLTRDIADVPAVEVITTVAVHLMSAAAVHLGLAEGGERHRDLDEARKLIHALAGLVDAGRTEISPFHAAPLRDGLKSLQLAFREASTVPDEPGAGPGERYTGPLFGWEPL